MWKLSYSGAAALGGLLMAAASLGPDEAVSNLAAWAEWRGIEGLPSWLTSSVTDFLAFIVGAALLGLTLILLVRRKMRRGTQEAEPNRQYSPVGVDCNDPFILQLRTDVMRLKETCSGYGSPKAEREDVLQRRARIQDSDHPIWLDPAMAQARRDFVHWVGVAQVDRERFGPTFETNETRKDVLAYLDDARKRLEAGLTGTRVPGELMPLTEAASIAFDRFRNTENLSTRVSLGVMSRLEGDDQRKLPGLVCQVLFNETETKLYGVYPPGKEMHEVTKENRDLFMFSDDASELFDQFNESRRYKNLSVRRADFERRLAELTE